jgi:hypothetical protein
MTQLALLDSGFRPYSPRGRTACFTTHIVELNIALCPLVCGYTVSIVMLWKSTVTFTPWQLISVCTHGQMSSLA